MRSLTGTNFTLAAKVAAALVECDLDMALYPHLPVTTQFTPI